MSTMKCKCILVDEKWIYEESGLTAESKLLIQNPWAFNRVHDLILRPILKDCLDQVCAAKAAAITTAQSNGTTWREEIDSKWLSIIDNNLFISMYSLYLEYYIVNKKGTAEISNDGLVEYEKRMESNSGIARSVSEKKKGAYVSSTLSEAMAYKELFTHYFKGLGFDCSTDEVTGCDPCQEQVVPSELLFAQYNEDLEL